MTREDVAKADDIAAHWVAYPEAVPALEVGWGAMAAAVRLHDYPRRVDSADLAIVRAAAQRAYMLSQ